MKSLIIPLLLLSSICNAQNWIGEVSAGAMAYNGDLTKKKIMPKNFRPGVSFNLKYDSGDLLNFRVGLLFGMLSADDKYNSDPVIKVRNLSFKTNIIELSACVEYNLFDPAIYKSYPYVFGGIGFFYFNPYTFDNDNKKTFLRPLSTEGQGLSEYPDRKNYHLTQFCLPVGVGWKWFTKKKNQVSFEIGYRVTFTDYLDDVSKTYVDPEILSTVKGPKAAELSYRKINVPFGDLGAARGNPSVKDMYYFAGLKFSFKLKKKKDGDTDKKEKKKK